MSKEKPEEKKEKMVGAVPEGYVRVPPKKTRKPRKPKDSTAIVKKEKKAIALFNMQSLMASAVAKGLEGVEILEKLVALRQRIEEEEARKDYFAALAQFQRDCPIIPKTKEVWNVDRTTKEKTTLRYRYSPFEIIIDHIKEPLARNDLSYTFETEQTPTDVSVTFIGHHMRGHKESTEVTMPIMYTDFMNKADSVTSAITRASRRALINGFGIATADPDPEIQETVPEEPQPPAEPPTEEPQQKVENAPKTKGQEERSVTPEKQPEKPPTEKPPEPKRKYTIAQLKGHCITGVSFLEKNGAIDATQAEKILKGVDELAGDDEYDKLMSTYLELRKMYDDWQKQKGKSNGK